MNRHKDNWSAMGLEPSTEPDALTTRRGYHKGILEEMVKEYHPNPLTGEMDGINELATLLRQIKEEQ